MNRKYSSYYILDWRLEPLCFVLEQNIEGRNYNEVAKVSDCPHVFVWDPNYQKISINLESNLKKKHK